MTPDRDPDYILIDITDVLKDYSQHRTMFCVYRIFPLQEMVKCILNVSAYGDDGEFFWTELDRRMELSNSQDSFNYDYLAIFYELLCNYLDELIRNRSPKHIDTCNYVFHKWINSTAVMLQKDQNARASHYSL